jgi:hypothetical protein
VLLELADLRVQVVALARLVPALRSVALRPALVAVALRRAVVVVLGDRNVKPRVVVAGM